MEFIRSPVTTPAAEGQEPGRAQWRRWAGSLRRHQLHGLVGWLLDAGRPLSYISAQLLYMASPLVGIGAERVGKLLESDEDSSAFARLLSPDEPSEARARGKETG